MRHRMFHLATVVSLVMCVALSTLWLRSWWVGDTLDRGTATSGISFTVRGGEFIFIRYSGLHQGHGLMSRDTGNQWQHARYGRAPVPRLLRWNWVATANPLVDHYFRLIVPLIVPAGLCAILPAVWLRSWLLHRRRLLRLRSGLCVSCGYALAGNVSGVCPECGTASSLPSDPPAR